MYNLYKILLFESLFPQFSQLRLTSFLNTQIISSNFLLKKIYLPLNSAEVKRISDNNVTQSHNTCILHTFKKITDNRCAHYLKGLKRHLLKIFASPQTIFIIFILQKGSIRMHASCISLLQLNNRNVFQCIRVLIIQLSIIYFKTQLTQKICTFLLPSICQFRYEGNQNRMSIL